jgi:hypothetical protein
MIEIELEAFMLTPEQQDLDAAGVDIDLKDCDLIKHTFFTIAFIRNEKKKGTCVIGSNGEEYTVNESFESVRDKIRKQRIFKYN